MRASRLFIIATATTASLLNSCKTPGKVGADATLDSKAIFVETATGAELVYDLSECLAKRFVPSIDTIFNNALEEVGREIKTRIAANPQMSGAATSSLDVIRNRIDFSGVTTSARDYLEQEKASIYGATGFRLTSLIPTGFILGFYHPALEAIPVDAVTQRLNLPTKFFPFVAVVVVPTCYRALGPDGVPGPAKVRFRIGAMANLMWHMDRIKSTSVQGWDAGSPQVATVGHESAERRSAPSSSGVSTPWRVVLGLVWGGLYTPDQLNGPMFGFGISRGPSQGARAPTGDPTTLAATGSSVPATDGSGRNFGVVFRPMIVMGSKTPPPANTGIIDGFFDTLKKPLQGDFSVLSPTHFMMLVDIYGSPTRVKYTKFYGGLNIVSTRLVEGFFERPITVDTRGRLQSTGAQEP